MKLTLSQPGSAACCAWVCYGSFQAGWQDTKKYIPEKPTETVLTRPRENYDLMKKIERERGLPFNTDVVRPVLPGNNILLIDAGGY